MSDFRRPNSQYPVMPDSRYTNYGDHANYATIAGNQIWNHHSGSGTQNNNNANGTQNINYGRDFNENNGSGSMTVNNTEHRKERQTSRSHATPHSSRGHSGYRDNRQDNEMQEDVYDEPPPQERSGPVHSSRSSVEMANDVRPPSGIPFSPEELATAEEDFRKLVADPIHYQEVINRKDAQGIMDEWQRLSEFTKDMTLQSDLLRAMLELSDNSDLFPRCLQINSVEELSEAAIEYGGFADIWTGKVDGVKMAVKVVRETINPSRTQQHKEIIQAFTREALVWRNLNHNNILPFTGMYWFNITQGQMCLVSPWMENGNLLRFLQDHPEVDQTAQLKLAKDVAQGLAYLHGHKIVHGDLKGFNVLIDVDWTARLTDFGLSRVLQSSQQLAGISAMSSRKVGTIRWLAPEVLKEGKRASMSQASDIYSFGCVCYEIYAKQIPFSDKEDFGIYQAVAMGQHPETPQEAPDGMQQLMEKCWDAQPGSRPEVGAILEEINRISI